MGEPSHALIGVAGRFVWVVNSYFLFFPASSTSCRAFKVSILYLIHYGGSSLLAIYFHFHDRLVSFLRGDFLQSLGGYRVYLQYVVTVFRAQYFQACFTIDHGRPLIRPCVPRDLLGRLREGVAQAWGRQRVLDGVGSHELGASSRLTSIGGRLGHLTGVLLCVLYDDQAKST